ncbi:hypothetical protein [Lacrimispora amygdalina]|uniref:hypothetical protein n=1 Tax=Lacrimispora amygdalina TaxID=253257 RepID=UPI000BE2B197|nr:hypothetical protein [Lacrimispora amygdalina]
MEITNLENQEIESGVLNKVGLNLEELKISQHAKERYAELIMDKDNKIDVNVFITNNEGKIKSDISKMIEYGQLLFSGKPVDMYNRQAVEVYLNRTWVVIIDRKKMNVITLYSIDLGLGSDFNQEYINKLLGKLNIAKEHFAEIQKNIEEQSDTYKNLVTENEAIIGEYKKIIKSLEQQNEGYKEVINNLQVNMTIAEKAVRDIVAVMIGKKVF